MNVIMATYVILSKLEVGSSDPAEFKKRAHKVSERIKADCPNVEWKYSYATLGPFDVVDIVEATDPMQVKKAAMIIRSVGQAHTETMAASPWHDFLNEL